MKNLIFMGTGPFALCALEGIYASLEAGDRLCVYTKEDKKAGRGMRATPGAVAQFAADKGLPLYQVPSLKTPEAQAEFAAIGADLAIVASYGLLLPEEVLSAPKYGCINIHASLLPEYRGAAPIQRAVMDGKTETGVTLQQMDRGLDTGDILAVRTCPIEKDLTGGELFDRLAILGRDMILDLLPAVYSESLSPVPQEHSRFTYAAKITKDDQKIDFTATTREVLDRIRALNPVPGAFCYTDKDGKILKIHKAKAAKGNFSEPCGQVLETKPEVLVKTGDGAVALLVVQPEGKAKMDAAAAVNGRRLEKGDLLR